MQLLTPSVRVGLLVFVPLLQVLNRRKVLKTSGKIVRPCVCAEKVSVFFCVSPSTTSLYVRPKVCFDSEGLCTELDSDF